MVNEVDSSVGVNDAPELLPGDIIFTIEDDLDSSTAYARHCMMIVDKTGLANVSHAIKVKGQDVRCTSLPSGRFQIVRCKNPELAVEAARIARQWSSYGIPFDKKRQIAAQKIEESILFDTPISSQNPDSAKELALKAANERFYNGGKYRAIKAASRRDTLPTLTEALGSEKGLMCSMFVIWCYQAAALEPYVNAAAGREASYVSDKHAPLRDMQNISLYHLFGRQKRNQSIKKYLEYVASLQNQEQEQPSVDKRKLYNTFMPSFMAWKNHEHGEIEDFDFANAITEGMCVDAKTTMPTTLLFSLFKDAKQWDVLPEFTINNAQYPEEQKQEYKKEQWILGEYAEKNKQIEVDWIQNFQPN